MASTERFLADSAPYGKVRCIRSADGGELTSGKFEALLGRDCIRYSTSAPNSPGHMLLWQRCTHEIGAITIT